MLLDMRELHRWWWGLIGQDQLYNLHKAYKWWLTQCQCHNFTFFQGYTLYIQLENAIPLGHLQVAISQKRKELPENHWSTERMLPNFLFHVHNTYVYIHHTYTVQYTPYVYVQCTLSHYMQECKSWNLENNDAAQSISRSLSHREQVHNEINCPRFAAKLFSVFKYTYKYIYIYILF